MRRNLPAKLPVGVAITRPLFGREPAMTVDDELEVPLKICIP